MRVFVAGATGVLGRALIPQLREAEHEVIGLARTPEKLLLADQLGATPVRGDVLDCEGIARLFTQTQPEAVVNLATVIPLKLRVNPADWEPNDRVRVEGTRNLLRAAEAIGSVRLFVQESAGYVCQSQGEAWLTEESPRSTHPFLRTTLEMEDMTRAATVPATLLRFAAILASDSWHTQQSIAAARRGLLPIIGAGEAYVSQIHAQDAAQAIVCALADPALSAGKTFHVVDDAPATMREVVTGVAQILQAPAPKTVPPLVARMVVGALTLEVLTASYRMSNARIRRELNFAPRFPTFRDSWKQIAAEVGHRDFAPSADLR